MGLKGSLERFRGRVGGAVGVFGKAKSKSVVHARDVEDAEEARKEGNGLPGLRGTVQLDPKDVEFLGGDDWSSDEETYRGERNEDYNEERSVSEEFVVGESEAGQVLMGDGEDEEEYVGSSDVGLSGAEGGLLGWCGGLGGCVVGGLSEVKRPRSLGLEDEDDEEDESFEDASENPVNGGFPPDGVILFTGPPPGRS
ncbi:hypothetical protein HDV00_008350 [Rhizophlyctis rosea]|nr:hypothetical protein HDV00_008350 [Rhizophlyctis rosea]